MQILQDGMFHKKYCKKLEKVSMDKSMPNMIWYLCWAAYGRSARFLLGGASMIIDSHAHYNNNAYKKPFRYLSYDKDGYALKEGELPLLMQEMAATTIIPLDRILVETDAPFILPYWKDVIQPKPLRRARNTSLILPAVIKKIAELKGISPEEVERTSTENTIRLFQLPITAEDQPKWIEMNWFRYGKPKRKLPTFMAGISPTLMKHNDGVYNSFFFSFIAISQQ